jgi:hypothetical protein
MKEKSGSDPLVYSRSIRSSPSIEFKTNRKKVTTMANPKIGERVTVCGYSFTWTESHLSKEELEPFRQQYDTLGAAALERIQAIRQESEKKSADVYEVLREHRTSDPVLAKFWDEVQTVPDWVDWDQLARGQTFFYRYAIANIVGFALQGFMAENSVLHRSSSVFVLG